MKIKYYRHEDFQKALEENYCLLKMIDNRNDKFGYFDPKGVQHVYVRIGPATLPEMIGSVVVQTQEEHDNLIKNSNED